MRKIGILILCLFMLVGCQSSDEGYISSSGDTSSLSSLDGVYYKIYNPGASALRENYYLNFSSTKDFENIGRDLQLLSSQYFSTSSYYLSDGQFFKKSDRSEFLQRNKTYSLQPSSGTVIESVNEPIMVSDIHEQNYWKKNGNKFELKGISLAIIIDPRTKNNELLANPMSDATIAEYGKSILETVYNYIQLSDSETMKEIRDVPILIAVYQGTDQTTSILDGRYIYKCYCDNEFGSIEKLNYKNVVFTSSEAEDIDKTTYSEFVQIKNNCKNEATEAFGLVGYGKYIDNTIQSMIIEAHINVKTVTELQYLTSLLADNIDNVFTYDFEINALVYTQDELKAVITKKIGKSAESTIIY